MEESTVDRIRSCEKCAFYQEFFQDYQLRRKCRIGQDFKNCRITDNFYRADRIRLGDNVVATSLSEYSNRHYPVFFGKTVYVHPSGRWVGIHNGKYTECHYIWDVWKEKEK